MKMGLITFREIVFQSYNLFKINNNLLKPIVLPLTRLHTTDEQRQKQELKKDKKLAKKLAALAAEPEYFQTRSKVWTALKKKYDQELSMKERQIINVTLTDGKIVEGINWETTPLDVAKGISTGLAAEAFVAKINDELWDLDRPLETNCKIQLLKENEPDAKAVYWSTAACTLAEALERVYGIDGVGSVCNTGCTSTGFFADIQLKDKTINRKDIAAIEEGIQKILSGARTKVERIESLKSDSLELFAYNQLKLRTIKEIPKEKISIYQCGAFIDVSSIPFMRNTKKINIVKILKIESVIFNGENVQRIHGIVFPSTNELKDFLKKNK